MATLNAHMPNRQLLIVENDAHVRDLVCAGMHDQGYECRGAERGDQAMALLRQHSFDVVILDVMLPGMSGLAVCREIRANVVHRDLPVLMLTARTDESDKLAGFSSGADDYLTKPFSMPELAARIGALARRHRPASDEIIDAPLITCDDIVVDPARRRVTRGSRRIPVSRYEFRLLHELASRPGVLHSREALLKAVWPHDTFVTVRSVDTLVCRLRSKLEDRPDDPEYIVTVRGSGYRFGRG